MSERDLKGHCLCGAVTVAFRAKDDALGACHCDTCRRWTGSAYLEIDAVPGSLSYDGPVKTYASSDWAERAFCEVCGTTIWYHLTLPSHDDHYSLAAGLVDNAGGLTMTKEIYIDRKPEGWAFAGDHPRETKADVEAKFATFMEKVQE